MIFMALVAVFQNNVETKRMLFNIDGMEKEASKISATKKIIHEPG